MAGSEGPRLPPTHHLHASRGKRLIAPWRGLDGRGCAATPEGLGHTVTAPRGTRRGRHAPHAMGGVVTLRNPSSAGSVQPANAVDTAPYKKPRTHRRGRLRLGPIRIDLFVT